MTYGSTLPRHSVLKYCASSDTRSADSFGDVLLFRALTFYLLRFVAGWDLGLISKDMFWRIPSCCGVIAAFTSFRLYGILGSMGYPS